MALEQFFQWAAGRAISRESVQGYVTWLGEMKFSPSTINQRLAALSKLATEAQRCGYVDSETAQAIVTVAGVRAKGRRLGRWLAWEDARTLSQAPNPHSIRGMRDRALLAFHRRRQIFFQPFQAGIHGTTLVFVGFLPHIQMCSRVSPSPNGLVRPSFGPATKPPSDIEISKTTFSISRRLRSGLRIGERTFLLRA
jgi:hypothetical protein